jgi:uncharacterized peroxidase-related enzyme
MSLINTVSPEAASGEIAELYAGLEQTMGMVPNAFRLRSASPFLLRNQSAYLGYYMSHPTLSMALLACIRMLVSQKTDCTYCIDFNGGLLINKLGWTPEQLAATRDDPTQANLPDKEKAMLLFVLKAVDDAHSIAAPDLDALRALGWSDQEILEGLTHGATMVAGDIVINAMKVERDF